MITRSCILCQSLKEIEPSVLHKSHFKISTLRPFSQWGKLQFRNSIFPHILHDSTDFLIISNAFSRWYVLYDYWLKFGCHKVALVTLGTFFTDNKAEFLSVLVPKFFTFTMLICNCKVQFKQKTNITKNNYISFICTNYKEIEPIFTEKTLILLPLPPYFLRLYPWRHDQVTLRDVPASFTIWHEVFFSYFHKMKITGNDKIN